jgi:hypothetical protein
MQLLLDGTALTAAPRAELTLAFTGAFGAGFAALEEFRPMKRISGKKKQNKSAMSAERGRPQACAHDSKHPDGDAGENSENRAGQEAGNQPVKQDTSEEAGRRTKLAANLLHFPNPAEREMDTSVPEKDGAQQQPRWPLSAYEVEQLELSRAMDAELKTASRLKTHTRIFLGPGDAGEKMGRHVFSVCAGPVHAKFDTNTRV